MQEDFLRSWLDHVDRTAAETARTAFLAYLADRRETDFWSLPSEIQADVVEAGCTFCDLKRAAFAAAVPSDKDTLDEVWRHVARQFQGQVDHLLLNASGAAGRA